MLVLANFIFTELGSLFNSYVELTLFNSSHKSIHPDFY
jgi:hypothetical protein